MKRILIILIILMSYASIPMARAADLPDLSGVWKDTRGSNTNSITIMRIAEGPTKTTYSWQCSSGYRFPYTGSITGSFIPTYLIVTKSDKKGKFVGTNSSPAAYTVQERSIYSAITYDTTGPSDVLTIPTSAYSSDDVYLTRSSIASSPIDNYWENSGSKIYYNGGNVGIGTTSPMEKLEIIGDLKVEGNNWSTNGTTATILVGGGYWDRIEAELNGPFKIRSSQPITFGNPLTGGEKVRITNSGSVGIGTTAPKSRLHVTGLVEYSDNAAALTGGLTAGAFYRTGDLLKVVH